jgi:hypothetical protein
MERKARDADQEASDDRAKRDAYRRTALAAITPRIDIGLGLPAERDQAHPLRARQTR